MQENRMRKARGEEHLDKPHVRAIVIRAANSPPLTCHTK